MPRRLILWASRGLAGEQDKVILSIACLVDAKD